MNRLTLLWRGLSCAVLLLSLGACANLDVSANQPQVWLALAIGAVGFSGMFCVFSYLAPTLTAVTGVTAARIPLAMVAFGVGGVLGSLLGGRGRGASE